MTYQRSIAAHYSNIKNTLHKSGFIKRTYERPQLTRHFEKEKRFNIDINIFTEKAQNLGGESLKMIYSFVKGFALTTATIVLFRLFYSINFNLNDEIDYEILIKFLLWSISFMILLVTYDGTMFGSVFVNSIPNIWITLLPAIFSVFEFLLFAILTPSAFLSDRTSVNEKHIILFWLLNNGLYHLLISFFCSRSIVLSEENVKTLRDRVLKTIYKEYIWWMERERIGSKYMAIISLALAIATFVFSNRTLIGSIQAVVLFIMLSIIIGAYSEQHKKRAAINSLIPKNQNKPNR